MTVLLHESDIKKKKVTRMRGDMLHQLSTGFDLYIAESRSRLGNGDIRDPNPGPAEDLKAMEESPKKSMPISLKRMDELVAWYLVCVTLAQQTTHAPTQKTCQNPQPNQTRPIRDTSARQKARQRPGGVRTGAMNS